MRIIIFFSLMLVYLPVTVQAQTSPPKEAPSKEAPKSEPKKEADKPIDLDAFFKRGEENAKTSSCDKPAKPAEPIA